MFKTSRALVLAALIFFGAVNAWCWGGAGHRIVAMIAEQNIDQDEDFKVDG